MTFVERVWLWLPISLFCLVAISVGSLVVRTSFEPLPRLRHWSYVAAIVVIIYPPFLYSMTQNHVLGDHAPELPYSYILIVTFCVAGFIVLTQYFTPLQSQKMQRPRLYKRLSVSSELSVARLTVEDHYTVVFFDDGTSERILMRFADAVDEMDSVDGFLTHRSHWVVANAVQSAEKAGNKEFLVMDCGSKVPVSKTYRHAIVDAGLL